MLLCRLMDDSALELLLIMAQHVSHVGSSHSPGGLLQRAMACILALFVGFT